MGQISNRFAYNALSGVMAQVVLVLVGFVIMPYTIHRLGHVNYGVYQLAQSALVFFTFLQVGMGPTLVRFCSQAIAVNDIDQIQKISSTSQLVMGSIGVFGMLVWLAIIPLFIDFYKIPDSIIRETIGLLICLSLSLFLNMTVIVPQGILFGQNRYDISNSIEIVTNVFKLLFVVLAFELIHPSLLFLGVSILLSQLFRFVSLSIFCLIRFKKAVFFSFRQVDFKVLKSMLQFSVLTFLNTVAYSFSAQIPLLIIGKIYSAETVTIFAPAVMITNAISGFIVQISRPLTPLATRDKIECNGSNLGKWSQYISQLTVCLGLACIIPLLTYGHEFMELWIGGELAPWWYLTVILALGGILNQAQSANLNIAIGCSTIKPFVYSQVLVALILSIGLSIGTLCFNWYLLGIAVFIVICRCVRNVCYLPYVGSKLFSYNLKKYILSVYLTPLFIFLIVVGLGWGGKYFHYTPNIYFIVPQTVGLMTLFAILLWAFLLDNEIKSTIRGIFSRGR